MLRNFISAWPILFLLGCQKSGKASTDTNSFLFDSIPVTTQLIPQLNEVSGIADSKINPGCLWAQEDSGNPPAIHLIRHDGHLVKSMHIANVTNRDWEDLCLCNGHLYIGDLGDNNLLYNQYTIYRFAEPVASTDTVRNVESISFTYPDGSHDAEAFVVDSASNDIFIITKRDNPSRVYKLSYPFSTTNQASLVTTLPYSGVVSAAVSPDRKEMIIKTYTTLYGYNLKTSLPFAQAFSDAYVNIRYQLEPQGEAVGFGRSNTGFYTLSEKGFGNVVNLYFYPRR